MGTVFRCGIGLTATFASAFAAAVNISESGMGQVLIYPYYTVRNGAVTTVSVQNHTDRAKALKVRLLEGKASKEVLDFNLYVSARDVWSAALIGSPNGGGRLVVSDKSCTSPVIPAQGQDLLNYAYVNDLIDPSLDRNREGYVEIIEMADLLPGSDSEIAATHVNGVPVACQQLTSATIPRDIIVGSGGLSGQGYIINAADGTSFGYNAVALANFSKHHPLWFEPGSIDPNLTHVNPKISYVFDRSLGLLITEWTTGTKSAPVDPVSAVLTRGAINNLYQANAAVSAQSACVVTMPTKSYYFRGSAAVRLFPQNLSAKGSCATATLSVWNTEEGSSSPTLTGLAGSNSELCWESSVINFNSANVLASKNAYQIVLGANFDGHMALKFGPTAGLFSNGAKTTIVAADASASVRTDVVYAGLPVVGFAVSRLGTSARPYPMLYLHRSEADIR